MSSIESAQPFRSTADELRALRHRRVHAPPVDKEPALVALNDPLGSPLEQAARLVESGRYVLALVCALVACALVANAAALVYARYRRDAVPVARARESIARSQLRRAAQKKSE